MNSVGGLFASASYSTGWARIPWDNVGTPYEFTIQQDTIWVGTVKPGRLYAARIGEWRWTAHPLGLADSFTVAGLGSIRNSLVLVAAKAGERRICLRTGSEWLRWDSAFPLASTARLFPVGDTLWAATWESGLWYRVWGESAWKKLLAPWMTDWWKTRDSLKNPRAMAWHQGALWIGDWLNELTEAPGGKPPYRGYRNCRQGADDPTGCKEIPLNILSMLSYRDHLFVSGHWPASGFVLDDSSGFLLPMAEGWCWNDLADCGGLQTRDLVGLGDTLYAAGSRFIMKFPLADLPALTPANAALWKWNPDTRWRDSLWALPNPAN